MDLPTNPDWWPAAQLSRAPIRTVFVCGRRLNPPLYSHVVNFPRLEIPLRGIYTNQVEKGPNAATIHLRPGSAMFCAPNCWNLPEWRPGMELLSIFFGQTQLGISLVAAGSKSSRRDPQLTTRKFSLPRPLTGPVPPLVTTLVELQAEGGPDETFIDLIRALMRCVEGLLIRPVAKPASRAQVLLDEIRVFLQSHYQYEITRDSVAAQFGISPNHLSRLFQTQGQITFSSYLMRVRIDRAKHLLRSYNLKLDDIAARCGYHHTPYFCHVFKSLTKSTPMEYRLNVRRTPE
ncbi:MAG TPA: helix-turn-helix transcriptional regulator [Verrucomicrobiae bacterium]|jgi:AraC-like DNA-binding protein|nr:helix-turn-helix transcriptional regulator [Verrucomicrobiae bacterium]